MAFIDVWMFVPPDHLLQEDGNYRVMGQHMALSVEDSLPGQLLGCMDKLPYLAECNLVRPEVKASVSLHADSTLRDEWRFIFSIDLKVPNERIVSELEEALRGVIGRAFETRKLDEPQLTLNFGWRGW